MAKTNKQDFSGDKAGVLEASWYSDISYKERSSKRDSAPPESLGLVAAGLPMRWDGAIPKGFDEKGFHQNDKSAMRMIETVDAQGRRNLVISFSGSDDVKDFIQDANAAKGIKGGIVGQSIEATLLTAKIGMATYFNTAAGIVESVKSAKILAAMHPDKPSQTIAMAKEAGKQIAIGAAGIGATVFSPVIGVATAATIRTAGDSYGGPEKAYDALAQGRAEAIRLVLSNSANYDRIIIAGHSLGGNLATQFSNELTDAAEKLQSKGQTNRILSRLDLQTVNSLWLNKGEPEKIGAITHYRRSNDLTDIVGPISGLIPPNGEHVVKVELPSIRPGTTITDKFDIFQIGERHGNSTALSQAANSRVDLLQRTQKGASEGIEKFLGAFNPIGSAKAEPLPAKNEHPFANQNSTMNGEIKLLNASDMLARRRFLDDSKNGNGASCKAPPQTPK